VSSEQVSTVVRFHDPRRLPELTRCVFSLVGQVHRPIQIVLCTQRFSDADIAAARAALAPYIDGDRGISLAVVNWPNEEPKDARSVLLNLGVQEARGKYLAFLDYDDVIYPDAYTLMIERLHKTRAAIAFASVRVMRLEVYDRFFYPAERVTPPFEGKTLMDLFRNNFCPLHSYLIDREQVDPQLLSFNNKLLMEEDYDVLLRICARYPSDFDLIGTPIGDYYYKTDGSNTVPMNNPMNPRTQKLYKGVRTAIEHRKRITSVSEGVQRSLGIPPTPLPLSIRDVVERYA